MRTYSKEEWADEQYKDRWGDNPYNRSRVDAGELPASYIGRRTVMVGGLHGCELLTEGFHFFVNDEEGQKYITKPIIISKKGECTMKELWMRAGIKLQITKEEEKILFSGNYDEGAKTFKKIVAEGRFKLDGETYVPSESVKEFNEEYGTDYEVQEYGWDV